MSTRLIRVCALSFLGLIVVASAAKAEGRNPGSLLVFPEFDNSTGHHTLITLTNANHDTSGTAVPNKRASESENRLMRTSLYS